MHYEELFRQIVRAFPSFEVQVENHLNYNDELLPHLLMADVGRAVGSFFTENANLSVGRPTEMELRAVLSVLNAGMVEGDLDTINVVAVSFVEHLWLEPYFASLEPMLGPALRIELERQRSHSAG
jgi:hypothetical protein